MSSYKSLSFFQVSNTGWFHTFDLLNFEIVLAWVEMMYEADDAFLHVHLGHVQLKSVARLHNNLQVTRLVAKLKLCKNLS